MNDEAQVVDAMPREVQGQERLLREGSALVKLENDTQMTVALQKPRDEKRILFDSLAELDTYKSCAAEAIYVKPVGKDQSGNMQYVEGLSIRAAESLANRWNNSAYGADIVAEDAESATVAAVFLDYEKNTRRVIQRRVAKSYKQRGTGRVIQYSPDRFDIVLAATQSKALREVILRSLPAGLKKEYENAARQVQAKNQDLPGRQKIMVKQFELLKITQQQLEQLRGKPLTEFTHDDITDLRGVYNAIRDGETTIEQLFEESQAAKSPVPKSNLQPSSEKKSRGRPPKQKPAETQLEEEPQTSLQDKSLPWHCNKCNSDFDFPTGAENNLCAKCLSNKIIRNYDREAEE